MTRLPPGGELSSVTSAVENRGSEVHSALRLGRVAAELGLRLQVQRRNTGIARPSSSLSVAFLFFRTSFWVETQPFLWDQSTKMGPSCLTACVACALSHYKMTLKHTPAVWPRPHHLHETSLTAPSTYDQVVFRSSRGIILLWVHPLMINQ